METRIDRNAEAGVGCWVVGPEPIADADKEWFARLFPKAAYVYQDHARLWLTAKGLGARRGP